MKDLLALLRGRFFKLRCKLLRKNIIIGKDFRLYKRIYINAIGRVILGDNCRIDGIIGSPHKFVCIDEMSKDSEIRIGNNVKLYAARINAKYGVIIGNDVLIEDTSILDTDFHSLDTSRGVPQDENFHRNRIIIGNNVAIGAQSLITKGVTIGDDVCVAPSTVVSRSIKPGHFAYGNPVVVISK
jgi:acetyltransferase-like isoleucine patch superfamily enzyme